MTKEQFKSDLLPNTYPVPNWIIDRGIWSLLVDKERNCYQIVVRKTLGWWKRSDRISKSQLVDLSGLSSKAVTDAMRDLVGFGLVLRLDENNDQNEGIEWGYQPDHRLVDVEALLARYEKKSKVNRERARKMIEYGGVMSDSPPMSDIAGGDMSDIVDKTKETSGDDSKESSEAGKPKPKPKPKPKKVEVPEQWVPIYNALVAGLRNPTDQNELRFWLFGSSAARGGAKGVKHYYQVGITPDEIERAFAYCKRERIILKNPNSLFAFADTIHRRNQAAEDHSEDQRKAIREKIRKAKKVQQ